MVKIVTDTTAALPRKLTERLGIPVLPQIIIFGEESYRDDTELDSVTFLKKLRASVELPKTAAPPPALYNPVYEKLTAQGEAVIVIAPSAKVSGTVRAAEVAAQDFPKADIRVVDCQTIAGNTATLVLLADQWAKAGMSADQITSRLKEWIPRQRTYFLVDTLEYLAKGGRIGGAKKLLGEMLQIKPILTVREGAVEPYEQARTKGRALERLAGIVEEQCPKSAEAHLCVMQIEAEAEAGELAASLRNRTGIDEIPIYELPPAIITHAGPKAMGIGFFV